MMKVLQINNYHYPRGGSETVYYNTGNLLMENGHDVLFFSSRSQTDKDLLYATDNTFLVDRPNYKDKRILTMYRNFRNFLYSSTNAKALEDIIKEQKPDIAHLHIFYGVLSNSILKVLKKYSIPTVMSVHEYHLICPVYTCLDKKSSICEKCKGKNYYHCLLKNCSPDSLLKSFTLAIECYHRDRNINYLKCIDHFIMVSNFIQDKHKEHIPDIAQKSTVIHNFVNIDNETLDLKKEIDFTYYGRLSNEKGLFTLLNAMKQRPQYSLQIVGTGPIEKKVQEYITENKLTNVRMLGYKTGDELKKQVCFSKCVVVPSEWYENNPLSVIESQSWGIPVIGSNIGGIPELIQDSHNGYLFLPGRVDDLIRSLDKMNDLDNALYKQMSQNAISFVKANMSKQTHYTKLLSVYHKIL